MAIEEEEPMVGVPEEEEGAESSNRMFMLLALGLGALFVVGLICIGAVFFMQQGQSNQQRAALATQLARQTAAAIAALPTATPPAPTDTPVPPTPTSVPPTNTPVVPTPTLPAPTETVMPTAAGVSKATATAGPGTKVAAATSAPGAAATATTEAGSTPQTGVGGVEMVLAAGALLVVLFAARRLRLAQH